MGPINKADSRQAVVRRMLDLLEQAKAAGCDFVVYPEPGDLGFPVWRTMGGILGMCICNDRRWPETYRVMGLQGVELVVLGYNTPSVNAEKVEEGPQQRMFHNRLTVQAGAYQNSTW